MKKKSIKPKGKKNNNWKYDYSEEYAGLTQLKDKKQELFVQEYLKDLNQTKAAIRAKYSITAAARTANRLLKHDYVRKRIEYLCKQIEEVNCITINYLAAGVKKIAETSLYDSDKLTAYNMLFKWRGMFIDRKEVTVKPKRIIIRNETGKIEEEIRES